MRGPRKRNLARIASRRQHRVCGCLPCEGVLERVAARAAFCGRVFNDVDTASGARDGRPELNRLFVDVHRRKCDLVLVWKLDRWGRSLRHLVNSLAELESRGVAFVSLRDNLDLSTPAGRLMFQVIGPMAEFERALIAERVKAGTRNARAKGHRIGRAARIPVTDELRAQIAEAYRGGEGSLRNIAARYGTSLGTVQRCIAGSRPQSPN